MASCKIINNIYTNEKIDELIKYMDYYYPTTRSPQRKCSHKWPITGASALSSTKTITK